MAKAAKKAKHSHDAHGASALRGKREKDQDVVKSVSEQESDSERDRDSQDALDEDEVEEGDEGSESDGYDINDDSDDLRGDRLHTEHSEGSESEPAAADRNDKSSSKDRKARDKLRKDAKAYRDALDRRGVVYLGRVPPFMKPNKVRTLLEPYGEITRLFLAEEDAEARKKRKELGGNASRQFREGWVEFADKKVAKSVAESLNNTHIGGRKSDYYHDDIWNLKYLRKFKWEYLTEKFAYERRVREAKLKAAMIQAKKNNAEIAEMIEKSKIQKAIAAKKQARSPEASGESSAIPNALKRKFYQRSAFNTDGSQQKGTNQVLRQIFPQASST